MVSPVTEEIGFESDRQLIDAWNSNQAYCEKVEAKLERAREMLITLIFSTFAFGLGSVIAGFQGSAMVPTAALVFLMLIAGFVAWHSRSTSLFYFDASEQR